MSSNIHYVIDSDLMLVCLNKQITRKIDKHLIGKARPICEWGKFFSWINDDLEMRFEDSEWDEDLADIVNGEYVEDNMNGLIGYILPIDWRYLLLDYFAKRPSIDEIEAFIGELGIRKAFALADKCGFYNGDLNSLKTDDGIRHLFLCILDAIIITNPKCKIIEEDEYKKYFHK